MRRALSTSGSSSGAVTSRGSQAAKQRPVAEASMGMTSPRRRLAVTDCALSSQCTMVGPWLPQTAMAAVWWMRSMSAGMRSRASRTGSSRASDARPSLSEAGPRS